MGTVRLDAVQSRHARDVLRMKVGDAAELFDAAGQHSVARVTGLTPQVELAVNEITVPTPRKLRLVIASAIPKGSRADWMIEKLSELDVAALVPLNSERSIVHPESGKLGRFKRIAFESAKQCGRQDLLEILAEETPASLCADAGTYTARWCLSTSGATRPIWHVGLEGTGDVLAAIGPEGGWTDGESSLFANAGFQSIGLTQTILRIETAAIAVAAIVMSHAKEKETQS